jgi:hypothetical protein
MQWEGGVRLCGHPSASKLPPCRFTWRPCCQHIVLFVASSSLCLSSLDFPDLRALVCPINLVLGLHALLSLGSSSLLILFGCNFTRIYIASCGMILCKGLTILSIVKENSHHCIFILKVAVQFWWISIIISLLSIFWIYRVGLWDHAAACVCIPPIVARQQVGKNPLNVASQRLGKNPPIVARQGLDRNVTAVTNTHATIEELLDASFLMWPVWYQGK